MTKSIKSILIEGPIDPEKIKKSIAAHQPKTEIGAHSIFLGQVREDEIDGKKVAAIEYSGQHTCAHVYHSMGRVAVGEICFFVFVSSGHRKVVFEALPYFVDELKAKLPVFGKELFEDNTHQWKVNT
jgi:molybdopterin synthase catalytic subunit